MLSLFPSAVLKIVIAFAMTCSVAASVSAKTAAHDFSRLAAAEAERHAVLDAHHLQSDHVHEDGEREEQRPGHIHGHNPVDHSHDQPSQAVTAVIAVFCPIRTRIADRSTACLEHLAQGPDRPPKH